MTGEESSLSFEDQARLEESQRGLERRRAALGIKPQRDASAQVVAIADQRSQRQKAPRRKHPDTVAEPSVDGDCWHQIDEGLYEAVYVGDTSDPKLWGGKRVARLKITDGTHAGKILRWYAQTPLKPGGRTKLAVTYNAVTGRRPPPNLSDLGLGRWLSGRVLEVKVEFTKRDGKGTKTTERTRYSLVSQILRTVAGSGDTGGSHA